MRTFELLKVESNNKVYRRLEKLHRANQHEIRCGRCRYNRGENSKRRPKYKNAGQ